MLDGPNRVAALVFHPHSGLPRPAVGMIANDDSKREPSPTIVRAGSITSFRADDVDIRFTLATGHFSAPPRTVETGQEATFLPLSHRDETEIAC